MNSYIERIYIKFEARNVYQCEIGKA